MTRTEPAVAVRSARARDLETVTDVLAEAFLVSPIGDWLIPDLDVRRRVYAAYFAIHVDHAHQHGVAAILQHDRAEAPRLQFAQLLDQLRMHVEATQVDERDVELARNRLGDLLFAGHVELDQHLADQHAAALLFGQRLRELLGSQQALFEQHAA